MSQVLIQQYLNQLQDLRKVSGTHRESVVREAFKDLLKGPNHTDRTLDRPVEHPRFDAVEHGEIGIEQNLLPAH